MNLNQSETYRFEVHTFPCVALKKTEASSSSFVTTSMLEGFDAFCLLNRGGSWRKCQLFLPPSLSAAHSKVMAEKVMKTQCTFHQVSLASVSQSRPVNKSDWQPGSFVPICGLLPLSCFIPRSVSLSCPSSSGHFTLILIPAFVSSAGSQTHWLFFVFSQSFWQMLT